MGCVYVVTNKVNGKQYVGKTIHSLEYRRNQHEKLIHPRYVFGSALAKYGFDVFDWEEIFVGGSNKILCRVEILIIQELNALVPNGYNITRGGEGVVIFGRKHSIESRKKMSEIAKALGRKPSRKALEKAAATNRGKPGPRKGVIVSEETKRKQRESHLGEEWTEERRKNHKEAMQNSIPLKKALASPERGLKISKALLGKSLSEEHKEKIRSFFKGKSYEEIHGKEKADEMKRKRSESLRRYWKERKSCKS